MALCEMTTNIIQSHLVRANLYHRKKEKLICNDTGTHSLWLHNSVIYKLDSVNLIIQLGNKITFPLRWI